MKKQLLSLLIVVIALGNVRTVNARIVHNALVGGGATAGFVVGAVATMRALNSKEANAFVTKTTELLTFGSKVTLSPTVTRYSKIIIALFGGIASAGVAGVGSVNMSRFAGFDRV
jgi:hypothetical protein